MAFSTGNQQFDFLLSRARNRKRSRQALEENNIDVETSLEKREEESESSDVTSIGTQVADMSGLGASGISATGPSQSIADAQADIDAASSMAGVGSQQTAGQVAFDTEMDRAKADFAQSNPVGAAIAGFSTDAVAQGVMQAAPLGLAMAGQMGAAKTAANIAGVLSGPVFGAISGVIGPTAQDPYGQNVAMGSGLLGQVSQSLMSTHYSVADKVAQGVPGYAQGYYGGSLVSVEPGIFGGLTYTGVNVPDIHQYSPSQFMADMEEAKAYSEAVEPFGGVGTTSIGGQGISVDTFSSPTEAAMNNTGYSSYGPTGVATGAAPPGSQFSSTGVFSTGDDNSSTNTSSGSLGTTDTATSGLGSIDSGYGYSNSDDNSSDSSSSDSGADTMGGEDVAYGGRIGMQMGGDPSQQQAPSTEMGFIGGPPDQFTEQQTIADDIPKEVPEGTFVINAPAVEFAGKEDIKQMLIEAYEIVAQADTDAGTDRTAQAAKVPSKEQVEIMISRGEVVVPPEIAKVIGYDRLEKINNRGKKEVARRQEESEQQQEQSPPRPAAEGGFISMQEGGNIEEKYGVNVLEPMNPKTKKMIQNLMSKGNITRGSVEEVIDALPDRDALAMMIFAESYASEDSPDAMRGIGETALNRLKDKTYSFKNQNTLKDVLKARSNKGSGSKMFSYEGLEPKYLKPRLSEMLNNKYWQRALDAADNALETEPDMEQYKLRDDVFTYARVGKASDRLKSNKRNEYFITIGDHDFYSRTPEKGGRISSETMGQPDSFYR